jgi:hypothetical protein
MSEPSKRNLHQRVVAIMDHMGAVGKGGQTEYGERYKYHKIDDIDDSLRQALVANGVTAYITEINDRRLEHFEEQDKQGRPRTTWYAECSLVIELVNADDPAETTHIHGWGQGIDYGDKATGKAISYAAKAAYLSAFHLRGQPDNEQDDIKRGKPKQTASNQAAPLPDERIAELRTAINGAPDTTALTSILSGATYKYLKANGPQEAYEKTASLAKAKHAILTTEEKEHAASNS